MFLETLLACQHALCECAHCESAKCMNVISCKSMHFSHFHIFQPHVSDLRISPDPCLNVDANSTAQDVMSRLHGG